MFALMKNYGFDILSEIKGEVSKKNDSNNTKSGSFYKEIIDQLKEYDKKHNLSRIVVASPSFWKDYLFNELGKDELTKKIITSSCNSVGEAAVNEVIRRPEIRSALSEDRIIKESNLVEELFTAISKIGHAVYGLKETENAVNMGAVKMLLVTDSVIKKMRESNNYQKLDWLMKNADSMKAEVHLICSEHEGGKKLDGLGGIGAVLRYRI
jgi:protein pelota